jgi:hypothetical protein
MGTASVVVETDDRGATRRCIDITELETAQVESYARRASDAADLRLERRGGRTYLVTGGRTDRR